MSTEKTPTARVWLVGHDFSACADAAADIALNDLMDTDRGGTLVLCAVVTVMVPPAPIEGGALAGTLLQLEEAAQSEAQKELDRVAARLREAQLTRHPGEKPRIAVETVTRIGTPAETLLDEAKRRGATRIVVGTHGRTGAKHLLLGSVAERVARRAAVPVLIAHAGTPGVAA
jgi:nucleotide-binding universal stress UspA family protein